MKRLLYLAIPIGFALLAACSGSSGPSESDIAGGAANFYRALSDDPPTAYTYLSADCRASIDYLDFVATINSYRGFLGEGELKVQDVSIVEQTHERVTADYEVVLKSGDDEIPLTGQISPAGPSHFIREEGRWRFEDCAGFPASQGSPTPSESDSGVAATPTFEPDSPAALEADSDPSLPGKFVDLQTIYGGHWGNSEGTNTAAHSRGRVDYSTQGELPPAGGPHWGAAGACPPDPDVAPLLCGPVPWGIYSMPYPAESVVHNMEHAGVIVWYNTSNQEVISRLEQLVRRDLDNGKFIVMMPYPDMAPETIALTAWGRRDKFSVGEYSENRIQRFIDALECRFDPERLCARRTKPTPLSDSAA